MKYKQQEEPQENQFLRPIKNLLGLNREFCYAVDIYNLHHKNSDFKTCFSILNLDDDYEKLLKLYIALDNSHKAPDFATSNEPAELDDLVKLEENYYSSLIELGTLGLKEANFEVVAYLSDIIKNFQHTICELANESNSTL